MLHLHCRRGRSQRIYGGAKVTAEAKISALLVRPLMQSSQYEWWGLVEHPPHRSFCYSPPPPTSGEGVLVSPFQIENQFSKLSVVV